MESKDMRPGKSVRLRSGGPDMVFARYRDNRAECNWFNKHGDLISSLFETAALEPVRTAEPEEPTPATAGHYRGLAFQAQRRQRKEQTNQVIQSIEAAVAEAASEGLMVKRTNLHVDFVKPVSDYFSQLGFRVESKPSASELLVNPGLELV